MQLLAQSLDDEVELAKRYADLHSRYFDLATATVYAVHQIQEDGYLSSHNLEVFRRGIECQYTNLWIYIARWILIISAHDDNIFTLLEETALHKDWLPRLHTCAVVENLTANREMQIQLTGLFLQDNSYRVRETAIAGCIHNMLEELIPDLHAMLTDAKRQRSHKDADLALYFLKNKIAYEGSTRTTFGILDGMLRIRQL